ncbi:beta strand repeat-containing protein, partial [Campylobacter upsaliensis]
LSYNQQGIQSRLIPSFLALSVISALYSPLSANWVINESDSGNRTETIDAIISNDITLNNKNTAIWTQSSGSGQLGSLTINEGVTIQVNKNGGKGIEINTGSNGTAVNNITNNGVINTKGTGISINDRSSAETITVGANGSITSANGNAIYVGNGSRVNHIDIQGATTGSGGIINRGTIGANGTSQSNGIKVTGSITSGNNRAVAIENRGTIYGGINIDNGTLIGGTHISGWYPYNASIHNRGGTIYGIKIGKDAVLNGGILNFDDTNANTKSNIEGNIEVGGTIISKTASILSAYGMIEGDVLIKETAKLTGDIWNQDKITGKLEIKGNINGSVMNRANGNMMKGIIVAGGNITKNINNIGQIQSKIEIKENSHILGDIYNGKTIQNGIDITNSTIGGNIVNSGTNANTGNISITNSSNVGGSIINQNGANFTNNITLDQNSKLGGISNNANSTMSGQLTLNGEVGTIYNAGTFDSQLNLSNKVGEINNAEGGTISNDITIQANGSVGAINNAGTMQAITNNGTGTLTLTNSGGTIDKITNGTNATATIRNQGKITNGIINDGGTLTVFNDFRKDESATNGYHTIGEIGKTANGVHIENNNGGKLHLNAWYFNKEDFTTQEERKNNSLLVSGNYAGITLGDVFVNTQGLDVDKTYNANTFIADKNGNAVGGQINNGQGIDVNKLHSVSGIYTFENYGGKGEYRAIINRDELSGKSLAQSIIYSQRVRNVNLSRILREATTQVFVSGKEGEV